MDSEALRLIKQTYRLWRDDDAPHVAAALTYYLLLSVAPLLVVLVGALGSYLGRHAVVSRLLTQANTLAGPLGERVVRELIAAAAPSAGGRALSIVAVAVAVLGVMRLFGQLRAIFDSMWDVPAPVAPVGTLAVKARWWLAERARADLAAFAMVLAVGVLFAASLAASAVVGYLAGAAPSVLPASPAVVRLIDSTLSILLLAALFAVVYRYLPETRIAWRDVLAGAIVTSALFVLGRIALGVYFTYASPGSAYGAAGSLVALLVWVDFSAQLALFGAEFTYLWAHEHGSKRDEPARKPPRLRPRAAEGTRRARRA